MGLELIDYNHILRYTKTRTKSVIIRPFQWAVFKYLNKDENKTMYVVITIDSEQDFDTISFNIGTYHSIKTGMPDMIDIFDEHHCKVAWGGHARCRDSVFRYVKKFDRRKALNWRSFTPWIGKRPHSFVQDDME